MRNKRSELNEIIESSNIRIAIKRLVVLLEEYQCSAIADSNRYLISEEFERLREALRTIEGQLKDLKTLSLKWEQME